MKLHGIDSWEFIDKTERKLAPIILPVRKLLIIVSQLVVVAFSYFLAFGVRFDFAIPDLEWRLMWATLGPLLAWRLLAFWYFKLLSGFWRYVTLPDALTIVKACLLSSAAFLITLWFWLGHPLGGLPRSVFFLEAFFSIVGITGLRVAIRLYREKVHDRDKSGWQRTLILSDGDEVMGLVRLFIADGQLPFKIVGFLDDRKISRGARFMGLPVLGRLSSLKTAVSQNSIDVVLIAMFSSPMKTIRKIMQECQDLKVACKVLRSTEDLIAERQHLVRMDEVKPTQVMGRKVVSFNRVRNGQGHARSTEGAVLVTGAAGSIGSELCRQLMQEPPQRLVMLDRSESGLYDICQELSRLDPGLKTETVICDITNQDKLDWVMQKFKPRCVYHAAALKHVPMMEYDPVEALNVNVLGSYAMGQAAIKHGVERFILISTDKAVNPVSIMGISKSMAEKLLLGLNDPRHKFVAVRFGNVINSNGSVVPLFRRQVEEGGPVTVTHQEATRFFMSIDEAAGLVITAGNLGYGGDILLLDMGEPIRIMDVAKNVIRLAGLEPGEDIDIKIIGLRPGERLHEELYWQGEGITQTEHPRITRLMSHPMDRGRVRHWVKLCAKLRDNWDGEKARELLNSFVEQENHFSPADLSPGHANHINPKAENW